MENHPIPQDVTGFQFKLIGNMTVKQFAYLATGVVFAWILLQLPISILIKFPFAAFSAILGIGLAYFPISGRPMDVMIGNYIKALVRPTQFIYKKAGGQIYFPGNTVTATARITTQHNNNFNPFPKDKLKDYLESIKTTPVVSAPTLNLQPIVPQPPTPPVVATRPVAPAPPPQQSEPAKPQPAPSAKPTRPILSGFKPATMPSAPESPNLITGATRDARGNPLSNILVEVKDKDDNPVRAFKTNEIGRFASATPLINGTYSIEFEDPKGQNKFQGMTINVAGQIIQPIMAISVDTREELRRSLFAAGKPAN